MALRSPNTRWAGFALRQQRCHGLHGLRHRSARRPYPAWDAEMMAVAGVNLDAACPTGRSRATRIAARRVRPALARLTGAQWFPALGDGACANVGSGAIGSSRIALTVGPPPPCGSSCPSRQTRSWEVPRGLWAYRLDRRRAVLGGALSNGGNLLRWVWETTGTKPASRDDHGRLAPPS